MKEFRLWLDRYLMPLDDPGSRLFGWNLLGSLLLMAVYLYFLNRQAPLWPRIRRAVFRRRYWWNRSTRQDYAYYLGNSLLKVLLLAPFVKLSFMVSTATLKQLLSVFPLPSLPPNPPALLLYSALAFIFDDLLRFLHHLAMHKVPFLWRLHEVHHSATVLTPITLYRLHPLESLISSLRNSFSIGISLGFFLFFFESGSDLPAWLGTAAFGFAFNFLGSNLRHSHLALSFGKLERLFISPAQHQLHHDRRSRDVNFGVSLAIWDWLYGSLRLFGPGRPLRFGLARENPRPQTKEIPMKVALLFFALLLPASSALADVPKLLIYDLAEQDYSQAFTELAREMGVEVEVNHGPAAILLSNLRDPEFPEKPDLLIQQDVLNLRALSREGLFVPLESKELELRIPERFRDLPSGWVGMSYHARTLAYNPDLVGADEVRRYEDLADPKWQGQFCLRKATYPYTRALIASMIRASGEKETEKVLQGWVANNDKPIFVGDLYVMQALDAGECAFGLVNSDYFVRYKNLYPESNLKLLWMNQGDRGVHVNVTGMAVTIRSKQKELARMFLEKLSAHEESLVRFADLKKAYPANPDFQPRSGIREEFGPFRSDAALLKEIAELDELAQALARRVGYNP